MTVDFTLKGLSVRQQFFGIGDPRSGPNLVVKGDFLFREDGLVRAFRHTRTAVDTSIGIYVQPGPFFLWLAQDHALDRANIDTGRITQTQSGYNVGHTRFSFFSS
jgi:hypothetical protein